MKFDFNTQNFVKAFAKKKLFYSAEPCSEYAIWKKKCEKKNYYDGREILVFSQLWACADKKQFKDLSNKFCTFQNED